MFVDEGGALWLSNPWLALVLLTVAVGLVMWCHRWLEIGRAPMPRREVLNIRDGALIGRSLRPRQAIRPSVLTVARFESDAVAAMRTARARRSSSNAA